MSLEGMDVSGKSADRQRIDALQNLFKGEQYERAALGAQEIIDDPKGAALAAAHWTTIFPTIPAQSWSPHFSSYRPACVARK